MTDQVRAIVSAISNLPPCPKVAQAVLDLLQDPDVAADRLAEVVQLDPALTANVLKAVNSAYYGLPRQVDSVSQAVAYLGNERFREVVMTSFSAPLLSGDQPGYDMSAGDLWHHSLATALMAKVLGQLSGRQASPALYTAALLHDIGKVVLSSFIQGEVPRILGLVADGRSFLEAEREVMGLDHARLGGLIAKQWRFSDDLVDLIKYHHEPEERPESADLAALYLANVLCRMVGLGVGVSGLAVRGRVSALKILGLKEPDLELALAELHQRFGQAEAMLEIS